MFLYITGIIHNYISLGLLTAIKYKKIRINWVLTIIRKYNDKKLDSLVLILTTI